MTPAEVRARVRRIAALEADPEAAHDEEDRLRGEVLNAIAAGAPDAAELAAIAIETRALSFPRWYA